MRPRVSSFVARSWKQRQWPCTCAAQTHLLELLLHLRDAVVLLSIDAGAHGRRDIKIGPPYVLPTRRLRQVCTLLPRVGLAGKRMQLGQPCCEIVLDNERLEVVLPGKPQSAPHAEPTLIAAFRSRTNCTRSFSDSPGSRRGSAWAKCLALQKVSHSTRTAHGRTWPCGQSAQGTCRAPRASARAAGSRPAPRCPRPPSPSLASLARPPRVEVRRVARQVT